MKVFGLWERLTKIIFFKGKQVAIEPATQTGAADKTISVPDMASNASQEMVLSDQAQTLANKTLTSPVVSGTAVTPGAGKVNLAAAANQLQITGENGRLAGISTASLTGAKTFVLPDNSGNIVTTGDTGSITSTMIADGTIVNADINASAAIDGSKIVSASASVPGVVTTGAQTLAGVKTFSSNPTFSAMTTAGIVHNSATTGALTSSLVVNADVDPAAAIADTKLATISTAGKVLNSATTATSANTASAIVARDANGDFIARKVQVTDVLATANALNLGTSADTVTIPGNLTVQGTTTSVDTTNLEVKDKLVTLNNGGLAASGGGTGIEVEENNAVTGYAKVTSDRNGWELKAPNSANIVTIPNSVAAGNVVLDAGTQTIGGSKTFSSDLTLSSTGSLKLPVGTDGQRPTAVQGMVRYNTTQNSFEGYDGSTWAGLGGGGTTDRITQANSFNIGDVVYLNGSTYTAAIATAANTAEVAGVVSKIVTIGSVFEITLVGEVSNILAARFDEGTLPATGEVVFLSPTNPGKLTITEPSVVGQVSVPVGIVSGSGSVYVQPKRGAVVGGANLRTQIGLSNNTTTNIQNITGYRSGEIAGDVFIDATADYKFGIKAQFVKDAAGAWKVSFQTWGDTPPQGFKVDAATVASVDYLQITMPDVTGFTAATSNINFALNAPAVGTTLPLQIDSSSITWQSEQTFRNRIINGDMRIDQRNAGANVSLGGFTEKHITDRFLVARNGGTATLSVIQQVTTISGATNFEANSAPAGFTHALKIQIGTAQAVGTGNETEIKHSLEGFNGADWGWGTANARPVTLSFWVKSSQTGNFGVGMRSATFNYSLVTSYTINAANTWEYKTITITPPTSGTFYQDNRLHHTLYWDLGVGSGLSTSTLNTWQSVDLRGGLTGGVKLAETAGATFYITGVQLEVGPVATSFERRLFQTELALCQRYYEKSYDLSVAPANNAVIDSRQGLMTILNNSEGMSCHIPFKVTKRIGIPVVTTYKSSGPSGGVSGNWHYYSGAGWVAFTVGSNVSQNYWMASATGLSGVTNNQSFILSGGWSVEAEL